MSTAVKFDRVSKKFTSHRKRVDSFQEAFVNIFRRNDRLKAEDMWVLDDVSFEIEAGESVALVGPNGTGKSTTLKLITSILYPNAGQIDIVGRVGALLELGAGFHPDLTGRENIFLNGSVLGLSRAEITQKLDDIIAFSELEAFLDMPVKHYSSGMFMRLGFSIAVYTNPDILLVDEVLAVGDAHFQRKCLDRIDRLKEQGVTIVLVSHNLGDARRICKRAIWMEGGRIIADGPTESVARQYLRHSYEQGSAVAANTEGSRWGTGEVRIEQLRFLNAQGKESEVFDTGDTLTIEIHYYASQKIEQPVFGIGIHRSDGTHITGPNTKFAGYDISAIEGRGVVRYTVSSLSLLEGTYHLSLAVTDRHMVEMFDYHGRMYSFRVLPSQEEQHGVVSLGGQWLLTEEK